MTGENGEIIADTASDEAFEGYWRRPDSDARALRGGRYFTGDTGYVDAEIMLFEETAPAGTETTFHLHRDSDEVDYSAAKTPLRSEMRSPSAGRGPARFCHAASHRLEEHRR